MANYPLIKGVSDVNACIGYAIKSDMYLPALILLYSAIDAAAWLSCENDEHEGKDFISWVETWMLPLKQLQCTGPELWAARCGVLHTFTSEARLTRKDKARQIGYLGRNSTPEDGKKYLDRGNHDGFVAINLNDLFESYKKGYIDFETAIKIDPNKSALFKRKLEKYFRQVDGVEADITVEGK